VHRVVRLALLVVLLLTGVIVVSPAQANPVHVPCDTGTFVNTGAKWMYCVPASGWNGDLFVWAHGYVQPGLSLDFANLTTPDGSYLPDFVESLGFAFATTSYRDTGLVILNGSRTCVP